MRRRILAVIWALVLAACEAPAPPPEPPKPKAPAPAKAEVAPVDSPTLAKVRRRGRLICGIHQGLPGFAYPDVNGRWRGFDVDICRALAAATLGDAEKVSFVTVSAEDRFDALRRGEVDVLSRNTSWTFARDAAGLDFPAVTYYDGQGFLAPRALRISSAEELAGAKVCVVAGTASADGLVDYFRARGLKVQPIKVSAEAEARSLYQAGNCDAYTADISALASARTVLDNPAAHVLSPDVISKEPLGPVVRQDDPVWADIVRWTVYALLLGEEAGLTSRTVAQARETAVDPQTRRLLGVEGELGPMLGLSQDWAYQAILQVGAYHEIFRRDLGDDSPLKLERGLNALWNAPEPGLMYAPPMR
jgi:general L-amino acid transport system substrate-binding protein